jgi:hypothetical protein
MFSHPAAGGETKPLVRGQAPSTPRRRRSEVRRTSIKKFFRVTPEENAVIVANAELSGLEQSSYLRLQALGKSKVRRCRRIHLDWNELRHCMGVINKAGNVVNQLVVQLRRMERNPSLANAALAELREAARAIVAMLKKL